MKKILLIGASGFVGSKLQKKLKKKYKIIKPKKSIAFNISNFKQLEDQMSKDIDIIINLSGQISDDAKKMYDTIVQGNRNIINIAKYFKKDVKIYFFSSTLVYGFSKKLLNEKSKISPNSLYTKYKRIAEQEYLKTNLDFKILRLSNIYNENKNGIIKNIINQIRNNTKLILSNKYCYRNYIHLDDFIIIFSKILETNLKSKMYNIGHENFSLNNILIRLEKKIKKKIIYSDKKINLNRLSSQRIRKSKILNKIKYNPKINLINFLYNKI